MTHQDSKDAQIEYLRIEVDRLRKENNQLKSYIYKDAKQAIYAYALLMRLAEIAKKNSPTHK